MADKLSVYNRALQHLGEARLAALTDLRSGRRELDAAWDEALKFMLEQGMWNFGSRAVSLSPDTTVTPQFGYTYAFILPDDWVRTVKISDNERFNPTLPDFEMYQGYILADVTIVYLLYVSKGLAYGADPGKWNPAFAEGLAMELAYRTGATIAGKTQAELNDMKKHAAGAETDARGKDAVNQAMSRLPPGRLSRSRAGSRGGINAMRKAGYPI